jgi:hypothetical protein
MYAGMLFFNGRSVVFLRKSERFASDGRLPLRYPCGASDNSRRKNRFGSVRKTVCDIPSRVASQRRLDDRSARPGDAATYRKTALDTDLGADILRPELMDNPSCCARRMTTSPHARCLLRTTNQLVMLHESALPMRHAILIAVVLVGCRQQATPLSNPFLAPERVPPPGTRTPPPGTALPYYDGTAPPSSLPPTGGTQPAPGSWHVGQIDPKVEGDARSVSQSNASSSSPTADPRLADAGSSQAEQIAVPDDDHRARFEQLAVHDASASSAAPAAEPRPFPDIADLPAADPSQSPSTRQAAHFEPSGIRAARDAFRARGDASQRGQLSGVQTASFESPAPAESAAARDDGPAAPAPPRRKRHAFDPAYAWLQGRLEHSRASQQWKLRYIPIDGRTDDFGGSVIVSNPEALGDLAEGDFVRVEGSLVEGESNGASFSPLYRIERIQPLAD